MFAVKSIVVIGAGMGGLAAALRLRRHGFSVTIVEKQSQVGGRSSIIQENGFRVDRGPTILVMKSAFDETYRSLGLEIDERLDLIRLDPNYRVYFHDNTSLDLFSDINHLAAAVESVEAGAGQAMLRFMESGERKYALGMDFVDRNYDRITDLMNPAAGIRLLQTQSYERLYKQVSHFFRSDKLQKAFTFHSMFLGLSPFDALAMYSLITYADLALGMWYPKGGIYSIIEDFVELASETGVHICMDAPVEEILIENARAIGVRLKSGEIIKADLVVSNADLPYTYKHLIDPSHRRDFSDKRLDRMEYSCSGYLLYLGVNKQYEHVRHQALYFAENYRANLDAIFRNKRLPDEPSFHLNIPTVTDPSLAPPGHSLLYVLAPMPNLEANVDWDTASPIVRDQLIGQLEKLVDPDLRNHIVWERQYTPVDFKNDINATLGTAFGSLAQGFFQSAYFRPHNKAHDIEGLYFVGQGTYPGIGMPMVLISAKLVTERIVREWL